MEARARWKASVRNAGGKDIAGVSITYGQELISAGCASASEEETREKSEHAQPMEIWNRKPQRDTRRRNHRTWLWGTTGNPGAGEGQAAGVCMWGPRDVLALS